MVLTMYLVLRKDLAKLPGWTQGSIIAQAAHGVGKCLWVHGQHANMQRYMADVDNMTKVVLSVKNQSQLRLLHGELQAQGYDSVIWTEQPENQDMCLVTVPYEPEHIRPFLKRCSLYA
ncbi:hypothetical protein HDU91_006334 [Kappamyces sp. JEL0680]|nr:hypothetical protein HDU91_006334 [Kappamyces sp. JEL0680]